ncbi:MAG: AbrB/MazE/SpoVT family DNA-binding domain-containing protein [Gammaproteobacteria bacterium]|nr:AbrB/MazE/SpoVT family DNA-binding domain-containing protein [Gammaproteobacteria bacterium]MCY4282637.1 AbrB/MazE/SpoVT family DNA-binding domain-containing protein [Gammaproteobacteria bacterium]MCY4339525.1 AbrB/MazE/SpoVT family DNA-binding domain-containing protein [Gammaproteobacteria bacterium]
MLAKLTSKNQLTLPKKVMAGLESAEYFDVSTENGRVVLTPVRLARADAVRAKLAELGITDTDIAEAKAWARRSFRGRYLPSGGK